MAYPEDQDTFRTMEDINGIEYDAGDTKTIFAKDLNDLATAIQNIEDFVGYSDDIVNSPLYLLIANLLYPVGKIVEFSTAFDPNSSLGFGTWEYFAEGQVKAGYDSANAPYDTLGADIGSDTHDHGLADGYAKLDPDGSVNRLYMTQKNVSPNYNANAYNSGATSSGSSSRGEGIELGGTTEDGSTIQATKVVACWVRTA